MWINTYYHRVLLPGAYAYIEVLLENVQCFGTRLGDPQLLQIICMISLKGSSLFLHQQGGTRTTMLY